MVKNRGRTVHKAKDIEKLQESSGNEVAIYRRHRDHRKIGNHNMGGRRFPDFYTGYIDEEIRKVIKKYHIPILVVHWEKYKKQDNQLETNQKERE